MTLRLARFFGAAAVVLALASGCVAPPELDSDWRDFADATVDERMLFARARRTHTRDAVATSRVAAGLGAAITAYAGIAYLQSTSWNRDTGGEADRMKSRMGAVTAGAALLTAVAVIFGGYHEAAFDRWGDIGRIEAERQAAIEYESEQAVAPDPDPAPARTRLFLRKGAPVPDGADGLQIVRVSGPDDSALADLVQALGTVQLPVLEVRGADGPLYVVGPVAVGKSLATRSTRR